MDAKLIEKLDRRRYKYLLWQTVVMGLGFPAVVFGGDSLLSPLFIIGSIGAVLFIALLIAQGIEFSKVYKDPGLKSALNDELCVLNSYKSMKWGFTVTIIVSLVLMVLSDVSTARNWATPLTGHMVGMVIIYVSYMTSQIAKLVYMRK